MLNRTSPRPAFAIFINTICEDLVPAWRDEHGLPVTYETECAAQLEIVDELEERLRQFRAGARDFEDAITIEEFVLPVELWPDGSISIENGEVFRKIV